MGLFINDQFWFLKTIGQLFNQYDIRPYNINDTFYYMGLDSILPDKCIQKIFPYSIYESDNFSVYTENPIIILDGGLYITD